MAHDAESRILVAEESDQVRIVFFVNVAAARMQNDFLVNAFLFEGFLKVLAHEMVGHKDDLVVWQVRYDLEHVRTRDADIAFGLDVRSRVDVTDERMVRILLSEFADFGSRDAVGKAAARKRARNENRLVRVQNLCGFAHEPDRGKDDHVGVYLGRILAELKTVAVIIRNAQNDFGRDVTVGENDRVPLLFQLIDFVDDRNQLFAVFERVAAKDGAWLNAAQAVEKFLRCHSMDKFSNWKGRPPTFS